MTVERDFRYNFGLPGQEYSKLNLEIPIFSPLSEIERELLNDRMKLKSYNPDEIITERDTHTGDILIVVRGRLIEEFASGYRIERTQGSTVSYTSVVDPEYISRTKISAENQVTAKVIPLELIKNLMQKNSEFQAQCHKLSLFSFVRSYPLDSGPLRLLDELDLLELAQKANFLQLNPGDQIKLHHGGYLFHGALYFGETSNRLIIS